MEKIFFYDLETTGLDSNKNSIHQLSAMIRINGTVVRTINLKIKPFEGAELEQAALDIGNVTKEQIMNNPLTYKQAYDQIQTILAEYASKFDKEDKFHLSGYNIMAFDNNFLRKMWEKCGDKYFGSYFWSDSIDVFSEASSFLRSVRPTMKNFKLKTVAEILRIPINESKLHDALYDVQLTMEVFDRINSVRKQIK